MSPRAQLSQERSRQRRDQLLAAAVDLFVDGGSRAVTHRAVAAAAGLPAATTTYYFASIDDLLREALHQHITQWTEAMRGMADLDVGGLMPRITKDSSVRFARDILAKRPIETASRELAVILGAARDPQLRSEAVLALTTAAGVVVNVLERAGLKDAEGLAEDMVAVIGGMALRRAAGVHTDAEEARNLVRALRNLLVGHLVGQDGGSELLATLRDEALSGRSDGSR